MPVRSHENTQSVEYPLLPLRDVVFFPETVVAFKIGRRPSLASLESALATDRQLFLVTQRQPNIESPNRDDLFNVGVIGELVADEEIKDGLKKVVISVKTRAKLVRIDSREGVFTATVEMAPDLHDIKKPTTELMQRVAKLVQNYFPLFDDDFKSNIKRSLRSTTPGTLANKLISLLPLISVEDKQRLLETLSPFDRLQRIAQILETGRVPSQESPATSIFIGHGRNPVWARVQLFLQNELGLTTVNYESESRVGDSIVPVLEKMLDESRFAVLILTAEDESGPRTKRARQNVVHEAGLFQGRLGFKKVVLLVQEGLEDFSNVAGLQHIRFAGEHVEHTFYELQRVLKREGLL